MARLLAALTAFVSRRPLLVIGVALLLTVALASLIPQSNLKNSTEAFSPDSPEVNASDELRRRFADADNATLQVIVQGEDVISAAGVETVTSVGEIADEVFGDALSAGPSGSGVTSYLQAAVGAARLSGADLASASDGEVDQLQLQGLQGPPAAAGSGQDPTALITALIGADDPTDAPSGLVLVTLSREAFADEEALVAAQRVFIDSLASADTPLAVTALSTELIRQPDENFQREVSQLFALAAVVIVLVLALVLRARRGARLGTGGAVRRSLADMAISMVTVIMAILWTQGLVVVLGPENLGLIGQATPPTQIVPILLLALGVDYTIHVQGRYREEIAAPDQRSTPGAVVSRLGGTVGVALFLSMVTTGFGFMTNLASPIPAIQDLGVLAAAGICSVFLLCATFLPALRLVLDRIAERRGGVVRHEVAPSEAAALSRFALLGLAPALKVPRVMLGVAVTLGGLGAYGLTQLDTEFSTTAFLPEGSPIAAAFQTLSEDFGGGLAEVTEVLVTGDGAVSAPTHNALAEFATGLDGVPGVVRLGGAPDVTTPVSTLAMAQASPADPEQRTAVESARDLGLRQDGTVSPDADVAGIYRMMVPVFPDVAGTVDLAEGTAAEPAVRVAIRTQAADAGVGTLRDALDAALDPVRDKGVTAVAVSEAIITDDVVTALSASQINGLLITLVAVVVLLAGVYGIRDRRPGLGVLVMTPVTLVVLWTFGLMAATGIPFDPVTAIISALVVGVGVDFCIHLGERFIEDLTIHDGDVAAALRASLTHTGAALVGSATTTTLGFLVLTSASIVPFQRLGVVTIYAMVLSLAATLLVLPSLLVLYGRRQFPATPQPVVPDRGQREAVPA